MGQQRLSFLSLMSIGNDIVELLTLACRQKGGLCDGPRYPRQRAIKSLKLQKLKGCNWKFFLL